jgi:hypothetical protein
MCAIDVQMNMTIPPRMPARRIFIAEWCRIGKEFRRRNSELENGID